MEYIKIKDADKIIARSSYLVQNPQNNKGKWKNVFNNNNPIHIELGMGRGDFIINMAIAHPNINYIGIELYDSQIVEAVRKLNNKSLKNLKLINLDAHEIDSVFSREVDTIYLTFCDPWPKRIDERKRFTHENYLKIYDKIFKKNKHIILKTDNKGFFAFSVESLSKYWYYFDRVSLDLHHEENPIPNIMTDFEKRYVEEGRPIYYLDARFDG